MLDELARLCFALVPDVDHSQITRTLTRIIRAIKPKYGSCWFDLGFGLRRLWRARQKFSKTYVPSIEDTAITVWFMKCFDLEAVITPA